MISKSFYGIPYMIGALFIGFIGSLLADRVLIIQNMFICVALANVHYVMWRYFKYDNVAKELMWLLALIISCTVSYGIIMLMTLSFLNAAKHNGFFNFNFSIAGLLVVVTIFSMLEYFLAKGKFLKSSAYLRINLLSILTIIGTTIVFAILALNSGQKINLVFISSEQPLTVYWYFFVSLIAPIVGTVSLLTLKKPLNCPPLKYSAVKIIVKVSITILPWLSIPVISYVILSLLLTK